jgi:hypothetical protein
MNIRLPVRRPAIPPKSFFKVRRADSRRHVGQINLLRRPAEAPVHGENYFKAEIRAGRVGAQQSEKRVQFD